MSKARGPYRVDPLGYKKANEALDKKAENARELGLDYEPAQYSDIVSDGGFDPRNKFDKPEQCNHHFVRDEEAVKHYCCQKCGTVKVEQPAPVAKPHEQEPVAYMGTDIEGSPNKFRLNPFGGCVPLYKKPQSVKVWDAEGYGALCQELEGWKAKAQRKGLTDEEIDRLWSQSLADTEGETWLPLREFARAIEAKLKEKNT